MSVRCFPNIQSVSVSDCPTGGFSERRISMSSACHQSAYWTTLVAGAYDRRAQQYRPAGAPLETEIRRLSESGLTAFDIATALRLAPDYVLNVLAEPRAISVAARRECA